MTHPCSLCAIVSAAQRCGELDARDTLDDVTIAALKAARAEARRRGIDESDVDEATFEGFERARLDTH